MPSSLRRLFATILVFCEPHNVMGLWIKHYDAMSEDYSRNNLSPDLVQQIVLIDIRNLLQSMGKDIRLFPLPDIDHSYDDVSHIPREIFEEASVEQNPKDVLLCDSLNAE
jgi:ATP-dependent DNA helicase PIF1